ncbi:hypothetical protein D1872_292230 [compost metagenome]
MVTHDRSIVAELIQYMDERMRRIGFVECGGIGSKRRALQQIAVIDQQHFGRKLPFPADQGGEMGETGLARGICIVLNGANGPVKVAGKHDVDTGRAVG